jgi:transposase InsO family protein
METTPWETIHIDLYGPKKIKRKEGPPIEFKVVTMIDPVTGWFEMCSFDDKQPETILNILEYQWLARYPRPSKIIADRGGEFIGHVFRQTLNDDYGIDLKLITTANPQANAVVERIHQVIGNMLRPHYEPGRHVSTTATV